MIVSCYFVFVRFLVLCLAGTNCFRICSRYPLSRSSTESRSWVVLISALSLGLGLMFGTAGLPHILMRFFTVSDAREARKSVFYATGFMGYFYILTFIIGFGAIMLVGANPAF